MPNTPDSQITIERTFCKDQMGRGIVRFTPVFRPDITAGGELRFAFYEAWEDEPETFEPQSLAALANAQDCLLRFAGAAEMRATLNAVLATCQLSPLMPALRNKIRSLVNLTQK